MYKTISFPKNDSGTGVIERLRIAYNDASSPGFSEWMAQLNSKELRLVLGDSYSSLITKAEDRAIHLSDLALSELKSHYQKLILITGPQTKSEQLELLPLENALGSHGTFAPNRVESIHRWYPYVEGFSSTFVESIISKWAAGAKHVYDPFAGTGTAMTVASLNGISGYFSEVNPFMRLVIDAKTNVLRNIAPRKRELGDYLQEIITNSTKYRLSKSEAENVLAEAFPGRPYFKGNRLVEILSLKESIEKTECEDEDFKTIARLALGSIGVPCSEMRRASDLRYRRESEMLDDSYSAYEEFGKKVTQILNDINSDLASITAANFVSENCLKKVESEEFIDLVITSPPYLNGTNYFRNTKIELWLAGFIKHERDLGYFTREAMIAGINNVTKNSRDVTEYDFVEVIARKLDEVAYDKRIPAMVRGYCSNTELWLTNCKKMLKNGARIVVDIGDSNFAGVHVPTDQFLIKIADKIGLDLIDTELVRKRTSNDGTPLKQVLLTFEKRQLAKKQSPYRNIVSSKEDYKTRAIAFEKELPYKHAPYDSRNWGHSLHSLCSYQGKLKPALAHFLVQYFTSVGDTVLDPLSGAGTIPLEAFLTGRKAVANDLQELGYILSSAKVGKPSPDKVIKELDKLITYIADNKNSLELDVEKHKRFGLNGKLFEYFHEDNLSEIFAARQYLAKNKCNSVERALVYSSLLHILHGNRPYALSRTSHPVTPFKPSGEYIYKDIKERLYAKISRSLDAYEGDSIIDGSAWLGSYQNLKFNNQIDVIITSPPFAESTRFYSANWLRLWMAGWEPEDFKNKKVDFLEEKQKKNLDIYSDFFDKCHNWLKPNGKLILHLGKTRKVDMAQELISRCDGKFDVIHTFDEDVVNREKFGIKDQGATVAHQYLFLMKTNAS